MLKTMLKLCLTLSLIGACSQTSLDQNDFCVKAFPIYINKDEALCISERLKADLEAQWQVGHDLCGWSRI